MKKQINDAATLANGVKMPWLGLGVFRSEDGQEVKNAIKWAFQAGYRHIDTAAFYQNETGVGEAVRESNLPREEIFVTTKVWNTDQGYDNTLRAFDDSMARLGLDYVDLYLVHWPVRGKYQETWRALESIYAAGRVKAIGVSNFMPDHLDKLMQSANVKPMVNQVELHPHLQTPALQAYCREQNIVLEAWSPIMKGRVMQIPQLVSIGEKYGKTAVQVTLRWMLQLNIVTIPKSVKQDRIFTNANLYDFSLSAEDIAVINGLDRNERIGPDPYSF